LGSNCTILAPANTNYTNESIQQVGGRGSVFTLPNGCLATLSGQINGVIHIDGGGGGGFTAGTAAMYLVFQTAANIAAGTVNLLQLSASTGFGVGSMTVTIGNVDFSGIVAPSSNYRCYLAILATTSSSFTASVSYNTSFVPAGNNWVQITYEPQGNLDPVPVRSLPVIYDYFKLGSDFLSTLTGRAELHVYPTLPLLVDDEKVEIDEISRRLKEKESLLEQFALRLSMLERSMRDDSPVLVDPRRDLAKLAVAHIVAPSRSRSSRDLLTERKDA